MNTPIIKVSLGFASGMPDNTLITFANNVHTLLYIQAAFSTPPVTAEVLRTAIDNFAAAKAAQPSAGKMDTAKKDEMRAELVPSLRSLALYVQEQSANNLAVLLSSGFDAASTNRTRYALAKPAILKVSNGMSGEALVTTTTESVARGCEVRVAEINDENQPGEFRPLVFSTSSRNIRVAGLTPGKLYLYQGRTLGGATTYSDWSDPLVQRVM